MDFLDQTSYPSQEFLDTDILVTVGGEADSIQNTLSQDRAAGANVWEDGALHILDTSTDHKDLSRASAILLWLRRCKKIL